MYWAGVPSGSGRGWPLAGPGRAGRAGRGASESARRRADVRRRRLALLAVSHSGRIPRDAFPVLSQASAKALVTSQDGQLVPRAAAERVSTENRATSAIWR